MPCPDQPLPSGGWSGARDELLGRWSDPADGSRIASRLLAYVADEPLADVALRRHTADEVVRVLVEVLALLVPLGTDRVALSLTGEVLTGEVPTGEVPTGHDAGSHDLLVTCLVEADDDDFATTTSLHLIHTTPDGVTRTAAGRALSETGARAPALAALRVLLASRAPDASGSPDDALLTLQYARLVLLGHRLALHPDAVTRLTRATAVR